jgi:carboxyl-terminal processing protease
LQNHSLDQIVQLVIGPAGSKVELQLGRPGKTEPEVIQVIRSRLEVPDVTWHMLPGHPVAHLAIESFGEKVHEQFSKALQTVQKKGARALVLDVRANSGGLKDQAIAVTSAFLPDGIVFIEQDAQGHQVAVPVHPKNQATSLPVVVLIDEGTASAAEIFAGALQDHGRAQLVGARTFGTGTVLAQFDLSDGSAIMLAVAQWLTPKKRQIWHKGITPDVEVALPREAAILVPEEEATLNAATLSKIHDKQLLKALEMLKKSGKW